MRSAHHEGTKVTKKGKDEIGYCSLVTVTLSECAHRLAVHGQTLTKDKFPDFLRDLRAFVVRSSH